MQGDIKILKEMKRIVSGKGYHDELTSNLDGVSGEDKIVEKFKEVYQSLYNSHDGHTNLESLQCKIKELIKTQNSMSEIQKVTGQVVKEAITAINITKWMCLEGLVPMPC